MPVHRVHQPLRRTTRVADHTPQLAEVVGQLVLHLLHVLALALLSLGLVLVEHTVDVVHVDRGHSGADEALPDEGVLGGEVGGGVEHLVDEVAPGGIDDVDVAESDDEVVGQPEFRSGGDAGVFGLDEDEEGSSFVRVQLIEVFLEVFDVGKDVCLVETARPIDEVDDSADLLASHARVGVVAEA